MSQRAVRGLLTATLRNAAMARLERLGVDHKRVRRLLHPARLGNLRGINPISAHWGFDRGTPVDRYYIEAFLNEHRGDVHGRVLEVLNSTYTERFGTGVESRHVLDIDAANPLATVVADLAAADAIPADSFDCFILTQTLQLIYDVRSAVEHSRRILRPGGVLLATVPSVSRVMPGLAGGGDWWRFTAATCGRLFGEIFGAQNVSVQTNGNVLAGIAFFAGLACEELPLKKLQFRDEYFPVVISVRAVKA